ncbi:hypothetical protein CSKR_109433 [Clonorchis sinensis]|uniref:Uncharacterized protein n=1 Tax=Clonorchis sinensis TaxID=79923 RepID=A0A419PYH0_CLOSI|nr:hypothetical protein CSKR_109433 [Clonorchis sinensis]
MEGHKAPPNTTHPPPEIPITVRALERMAGVLATTLMALSRCCPPLSLRYLLDGSPLLVLLAPLNYHVPELLVADGTTTSSLGMNGAGLVLSPVRESTVREILGMDF